MWVQKFGFVYGDGDIPLFFPKSLKYHNNKTLDRCITLHIQKGTNDFNGYTEILLFFFHFFFVLFAPLLVSVLGSPAAAANYTHNSNSNDPLSIVEFSELPCQATLSVRCVG